MKIKKRKKLTRHELKEDILAMGIKRLIEYLRTNPAQLQTYAGIALGVIIVVFVLLMTVTGTIKGAEQQFAKAQATYEKCTPLYKESFRQALNEYQQVSNKYGWSKWTKPAKFYEAMCLVQLEDYDKAKAQFEKFLQKYPKHFLASSALQGLAQVYEEQKNFDKAIKTYQRILQEYPKEFNINYAWLSIGRCYQELGNLKKAKESYGKVSTASSWADEARFYYHRLKK
ncbi:MAG: tetratricopeptide repeat protein [Nitrospirota bacterium]